METYSVITGDLIGSLNLEPEAIKAMLQAMTHDLDAEILTLDLSIFQYRGDGFQLICKDSSRGVRVMLLIRAWLAWRSHEFTGEVLGARLFLGVGAATVLASLGASAGDAFTFSGRGLDALKRPFTMGMATYKGPEADKPLQHMVIMLDEISSRWKTSQAEAMFYLLKGHTYAQIASIRKKSIASIGQASRASGWPRLADSLIFMDTLLR